MEAGGMKDVPMNPGEEDWASFKCGGGPHAHKGQSVDSRHVKTIDTENKKFTTGWTPPAVEHLPPLPTPLMPPTSPATVFEKYIGRMFDSENMKSGANMARLLVYTTVNIARYNRSMSNDPQHYKRLTDSAIFMAKARFNMAISQGVSPLEVRDLIESIPWESSNHVPKPVITVPISYDCLEEASVSFKQQTPFERQNLPG